MYPKTPVETWWNVCVGGRKAMLAACMGNKESYLCDQNIVFLKMASSSLAINTEGIWQIKRNMGKLMEDLRPKWHMKTSM